MVRAGNPGLERARPWLNYVTSRTRLDVDDPESQRPEHGAAGRALRVHVHLEAEVSQQQVRSSDARTQTW